MGAVADVVAGLPVGGIGIGGVLSAVGYAILSGRLVPRRAVADVREDRDARLAEIRREAEDWKAAWTAQAEVNRVYADQVRELIELGRATNEMIRTLPGPVERGSRP